MSTAIHPPTRHSFDFPPIDVSKITDFTPMPSPKNRLWHSFRSSVFPRNVSSVNSDVSSSESFSKYDEVSTEHTSPRSSIDRARVANSQGMPQPKATEESFWVYTISTARKNAELKAKNENSEFVGWPEHKNFASSGLHFGSNLRMNIPVKSPINADPNLYPSPPITPTFPQKDEFPAVDYIDQDELDVTEFSLRHTSLNAAQELFKQYQFNDLPPSMRETFLNDWAKVGNEEEQKQIREGRLSDMRKAWDEDQINREYTPPRSPLDSESTNTGATQESASLKQVSESSSFQKMTERGVVSPEHSVLPVTVTDLPLDCVPEYSPDISRRNPPVIPARSSSHKWSLDPELRGKLNLQDSDLPSPYHPHILAESNSYRLQASVVGFNREYEPPAMRLWSMAEDDDDDYVPPAWSLRSANSLVMESPIHTRASSPALRSPSRLGDEVRRVLSTAIEEADEEVEEKAGQS